MSEVMAVEKIAGEYAKFNGYLVEYRVPFKKTTANSDIDVLGFNPKNNETLVIECKAWGSPENYPKFNSFAFYENFFDKIICDWKIFIKSATNNWKLKKLNNAWFVIPGNCDHICDFELKLKKKYRLQCKIIPIHRLITEILVCVKNDKDIRRKRYSDSALELCRWLLRGFENDQIDLNEIYYQISTEKETYLNLKRKYLKQCLNLVLKNVKRRTADINTRISALKILLKLKYASKTEMTKYSDKNNMKMNYKRIEVGLCTWISLGIIIQDKDKKYFISPEYVDILKKELKKITVG